MGHRLTEPNFDWQPLNRTPDLCPNQRILLNDSMFLGDERHPGASDCLFSPIRLFNPSLSSLIKLNSAWTAPDRTRLQLRSCPDTTSHHQYSFWSDKTLRWLLLDQSAPAQHYSILSVLLFPEILCVCGCVCVCEEVRLKDESLLTVGGNLTLSRLLHQMMNAESLHAKTEKLWVLAALLSRHHSGESIWAFFGKALTFRPLLKLLSDYF